MCTEITYLKSVLKKIKIDHNNNKISLKENTGSPQLTAVELIDIENEFITLKPDNAGFQIFNSGYAAKQCDYIVLSRHNGKKMAVFIELKSSVNESSAQQQQPIIAGDNYEDYVTQFRGSCCLFDFLHSILVNFCKNSVLNNEYERRFVVLHNKNLPVLQLSIPPTRPVENKTPERAYIRKTENNSQVKYGSLIR